ncbi:FAD-dependent oxidoreductase [Nocardiopsis metallicus]|uniref:Ferredoxin-NADP reductase n=1 Tax=Nocardiopsis metallicus TaxID=179819 RepID=A0A840VYD2_9ACTN|nr:oxidoreductase [Nocardiopsis metallicus]MBB5489429.1 ferredoxin-NADP reductase [Nocardiopsis metallicus]
MRRLLAPFTGQVTMYRLVSVTLGAIALAALVQSALGVLAFDLLDVALSLAVSVGAALLTGWLVPKALGVRPHLESSLVTGLILFLILWPESSLTGLLALAVAAALATLSKYVLTWRGRHVFNPAAFALVVVGVAGIASPSWWVGSASLLPLVAVAAYLVVRRLGVFPFVGVFLLVSGGINLYTTAASGIPVVEAAWTVLASSPLLFLAAFMLTEPLTTPPRWWQRGAVAATVGVLDGVVFTFGPVYSSPELALLAGNLLAFAFGQRHGVRLRLLSRHEPAPGTVELVLSASRPLRFEAGQYLELSLPHARPDSRGTRRMFSIASPPGNPDEISLAMRLPENPSSFKRAVTTLEPGQELHATGISGDFVLPSDPAAPVLMVAGGIGVTPFASMAAEQPGRDAVLVHCVNDPADLTHTEVFSKAGTRVVIVCPDPRAGQTASAAATTSAASASPGTQASWASPSTRTASAALNLLEGLPENAVYGGPHLATALGEHVPDLAERTAYVAGSPAMVTATRRTLRLLGARKVRVDAFSGY